MSLHFKKVIRDPVYEYIGCTEQELKIIDSPWFQRLRHCAQHGSARLVYPSLTGTRFEHSLGVMKLAGDVVDALFDEDNYRNEPTLETLSHFRRACIDDFLTYANLTINEADVQDEVKRVVRLAALLHDIGHFPLSHTVESAFVQLYYSTQLRWTINVNSACHEVISADVVRHMAFVDTEHLIAGDCARAIILVLVLAPNLSGIYSSVFPLLHQIIAGDFFDVDRLDYLQRDLFLCAGTVGGLDVTRLIKSLRIYETDSACPSTVQVVRKPDSILEPPQKYSMFPDIRALSSVESSVLERYKELSWVINHHKVVFYDAVVKQIARKLLRKKEFCQPAFVECTDNERKALEHLDKSTLNNVPRSDGDITPGTVPSLIYFHATDDAAPNGFAKDTFFKLNPECFVSVNDTCLLDDIWFCSHFREEHTPHNNNFYIDTLVRRKKTSISLWKDYRVFSPVISALRDKAEVQNMVNRILEDKSRKVPSAPHLWHPLLRTAAASAEQHIGDMLARGATQFSVTDNPKMVSDRFMDVVWPECFLKDESWMTWLALECDLQEMLNERSMGSARAFCAPLHWGKFFKNPRDKYLLDRNGKRIELAQASPLLNVVANYAGHLPFYVYFGTIEDAMLDELKKRSDELIGKVAETVAKWMIECYDSPYEIKKKCDSQLLK